MAWWDDQDDQRRAVLSARLDTERGRTYLRYTGEDRGFAAWLLVTDVLCIRRVGVSIFDLADWSWRGAYDAGQTPGEALSEALEDDGTFEMLSGAE